VEIDKHIHVIELEVQSTFIRISKGESTLDIEIGLAISVDDGKLAGSEGCVTLDHEGDVRK
jgi:hypothetical protein